MPRRQWLAACVAAEAVGMTAAAGAAVLADRLGPGATALALVVAGGLVEGTALGLLQGSVLQRWLGGDVRRRWLVATVLVAGVGWAAASSPAALQDPVEGGGSGGEPSVWLVVAGASALGAVMGLLLGAAQAWALSSTALPHPWRWVAVSTAGWTVTMPVIFAGATTPGADWPAAVTVLSGTATGVVAGTVLGAVSGHLLRRLV